MHQSIPAMPIAPGHKSGIRSRFETGDGAYDILLPPGGRAYAHPRDDLGAFDTLACQVLVLHLKVLVLHRKLGGPQVY